MNFAVNTLFFFFLRLGHAHEMPYVKPLLFPEKRRSPGAVPWKCWTMPWLDPRARTTATSLLTFLAYEPSFPFLWSLPGRSRKWGPLRRNMKVGLSGEVSLLYRCREKWGRRELLWQTAVQLRSRLLGGRVLSFSFLSAYFLCMEKQPSDPWSRVGFVTLLLVVPFPGWPVNKRVREGFVFFTIICSELSLW